MNTDTDTCLVCRGELATAWWRCEACEAPLPCPPLAVTADALHPGAHGLWRYLPWLPLDTAVSLGEPATPLISIRRGDRDILLKLEGALPTGSFKDRGASVMISRLASIGVPRVLLDSSGNAGASVAAYAARAGLRCRLFMPARASGPKVSQAHAYGAEVTLVPGPRERATQAAMAALDMDTVYAAHAWNPYFLAGTATFAFELYEQLHGAPEAVILPAGNCSLLLGVFLGFSALVEAGLVATPPKLFAVQPASCAPLAKAFARGLDSPAPVHPRPTVAEGAAIARPPRGRGALAAVKAGHGAVVAVSEREIESATRYLGRTGVFAEPSGALAFAGASHLMQSGKLPEGTVVVAVTGTGLKTTPDRVL